MGLLLCFNVFKTGSSWPVLSGEPESASLPVGLILIVLQLVHSDFIFYLVLITILVFLVFIYFFIRLNRGWTDWTITHLEFAYAVNSLQVEIGELKGRLTEVISNCDALCKRIEAEGPESLRSSIKPFAIAKADQEICSSSTSLQTVKKTSPPGE